MPKIPSLHAVLQGWLFDGPLAAYVPAYVERLERGRYASSTSRRWLNAVAHFAHWMSLCRLPVDRLDESRIDQFLQDHLPHCGIGRWHTVEIVMARRYDPPALAPRCRDGPP